MTIEIRDPNLLAHSSLRALPERLLRPKELATLVSALGTDPHRWQSHIRYDPAERWHARVYWSPTVEVYLLSWDIGQDTRVHDHGGSSGAFYVAGGTLTEQYGHLGVVSLDERTHSVGAAARFGPDYVHNLQNEGPAQAVSVHAYSPPLSIMRFYAASPRSGAYVPSYQLPCNGPEPDDTAPPIAIGATPG